MFFVESAEVRREIGRYLREVFLVGGGEQRLPAGDGWEALQLDQLRQHLARGVAAQRKIHGEEMRPLGFLRHLEAWRDGGFGVGAERGLRQLADNIIRRGDQRLDRVRIEKQR